MAFAVFVAVVFFQPGQGFGSIGQAENGRELGALAAEAHHARIGASAGQAEQGIHNQGFAGTGLTGDDSEAIKYGKIIGRNHGEIGKLQLRQHVGYFARFAPAKTRACLNFDSECMPMLCPASALTYAKDMNFPLDPRARRLLHALIAQHIREGTPVPSRMLAKQAGLEVSPATIRNIMANLEDVGLLAAPHTSAGRVPTAQAYRLFVDSLLEVAPLREPELDRLREQMAPGVGTQTLLAQASEMLSAMSQFVGVVTVPQRGQSAFKHIDFLALDDNRVLVILVFADNEVQNRIVQLQRPFSSEALEQTANYLNRHFAGQGFAQIRRQLVAEMQQAKSEMDTLLSAALDISQQLLAAEPRPEDMVLTGQTRLMGAQGLSDMDRLRSLFEAFSRKREILGLLESCADAQGVRVFIGEESGLAPLQACTVITAPYSSQGQVLGVLGVIGPTRMPYERVIPIVQATAELLGDALKLD